MKRKIVLFIFRTIVVAFFLLCFVSLKNVYAADTCNLVPTDPNPFTPKPYNNISFKITGPLTSGNASDKLHVYVKLNNDQGPALWPDICIERGRLSSSLGYPFGVMPTGKYFIAIRNGCTPLGITETTGCYAYFYTDPNGGGLGSTGNPENPVPPGPCSPGANVAGACTKVDTGLGISIGTDAISLTRSLFGIILSISGGIALLLIIMSGYKLLTSQGNPEAVKGAREQLTAAIVGLVFIILSLVILQIVGVNILHIPGFG